MLALIRWLPFGSPLHRATDPDGALWTQTDELLASLIEVVDLSNRLFIQAHSKKGARQPKPIKVPRPDRTPKQKKFSSSEDLARFAEGWY